jgi:hypothetical protein
VILDVAPDEFARIKMPEPKLPQSWTIDKDKPLSRRDSVLQSSPVPHSTTECPGCGIGDFRLLPEPTDADVHPAIGAPPFVPSSPIGSFVRYAIDLASMPRLAELPHYRLVATTRMSS